MKLDALVSTAKSGAKLVGSFVKNNGSAFCLIGGTALIIVGAIGAGKKGPELKEKLEEAKEEKGSELTAFEKGKVFGKTCGVNVLEITGGVALTWTAYFIERHGRIKATKDLLSKAAEIEILRRGYKDLRAEHQSYLSDSQAVMTQEQKDVVANNGAIRRQKQHPVDYGHIIDTGSGDTLFYEPESGQYFTASPEYVAQSVNTFNYNAMTNNGQGSVNDWLECLGLEQGGLALNRYGWDVISDRLLDVNYYQPKPLEDTDAKWAAELVYSKAAHELD